MITGPNSHLRFGLTHIRPEADPEGKVFSRLSAIGTQIQQPRKGVQVISFSDGISVNGRTERIENHAVTRILKRLGEMRSRVTVSRAGTLLQSFKGRPQSRFKMAIDRLKAITGRLPLIPRDYKAIMQTASGN